jgi:hypothetical protein
MLISASIANGRLIVVCAKDASIPPPLVNAYQRGNAHVAVVEVCEVFPTPVIVTLPTPVVSMLTFRHLFWFYSCHDIAKQVWLLLKRHASNGNVQLGWCIVLKNNGIYCHCECVPL